MDGWIIIIIKSLFKEDYIISAYMYILIYRMVHLKLNNKHTNIWTLYTRMVYTFYTYMHCKSRQPVSLTCT